LVCPLACWRIVLGASRKLINGECLIGAEHTRGHEFGIPFGCEEAEQQCGRRGDESEFEGQAVELFGFSGHYEDENPMEALIETASKCVP